MKRRLTKLVVFLLLGAVVNVAVAWGFAWKLNVYRVPVTGGSETVAGVVGATPRHVWIVRRYNRTGATRVFSHYSIRSMGTGYDGDPGSLLPSWNQDYFFSGIRRDELDEVVRIQDGRGWPMLALWGQAVVGTRMSLPFYREVEYAILLTGSSTDPSWAWASGTFVGGSGGYTPRVVRFLPLHPIWPGFLINTIFYAAILWLLALVPFTACRLVRRKRGLCIKCAYDLRGDFSAGCPECGWRREDVT